MPTICERSKLELEWYFTCGGECQRSYMGPLLDAAQARYTDSTGKVTGWHEGNWAYIKVHDAPSREPSYTPDHTSTMRLGLITRKLSRVSTFHRAALEILYGHIGALWRTHLPRYKWCSLGPLTKSGRQYLRELYRLPAYKELTDDQIIMNECRLQAEQPNQFRKIRLDKIEMEGIQLRFAAELAYEAAGRQVAAMRGEVS